MSNSSASNVLSAFSGTYFQWLEKDVFPYLSGCATIFILVIGIILNSILLCGMRKDKLHILSGKKILFQLVIVDFVTYILVFIPSIITAFAKTWLLSQPICIISGISVSSCFCAVFIFMALLGVERLVKLWNSNLYDSTFGQRIHCIVILIALWLYCCALPAFPLAGWGQIEYISYQHQCAMNYGTNVALLNTIISLGFYIPFCILCGSFMFIYAKREQLRRDLTKIEQQADINTEVEIKLTKQERPKKELNLENEKQQKLNRSKTAETGRRISTILVAELGDTTSDLSKTKQEVNSIELMTSDNIDHETEKCDEQVVESHVADDMQTGRNKNAISVYDGSKEQIDFRLALTYFTMWIVLVTLWCPYIILSYLRVYNTIAIWNGWMTLAVVIGNISYCIKPIIFITHNNVFKAFAIDSVPVSVRKQANKARKAINRTTKKVDSFVFLQIKEPTFINKDNGHIDKTK